MTGETVEDEMTKREVLVAPGPYREDDAQILAVIKTPINDDAKIHNDVEGRYAF